MMRPGMMGHGMMGGMPMMGPREHMTKVMFTIADTNCDGALFFKEVTAVHKRIFERVDANKDGKVSPEDIQIFMRE
jgi:EF hand domain-containing protein